MTNKNNMKQATTSSPGRGKKLSRNSVILLLVLLVVLIGLGAGGYLLYTNANYYSTDDAQVTGNIVNIAAQANGTLDTLTVQVGDFVSKDEVIGTVKIWGSYATETVKAKFAGVIVQVPGAIGQIVGPGVAIAQEIDPSSIKITAYVDESAIKTIALGQRADIHVDAYSGMPYSGHVSQIVGASAGTFSLLPTEDTASGNFTKVSQRVPVNIFLDGNANLMLLPGMSVEVTIHLH
jgi:multidrug resistance efflux pump